MTITLNDIGTFVVTRRNHAATQILFRVKVLLLQRGFPIEYRWSDVMLSYWTTRFTTLRGLNTIFRQRHLPCCWEQLHSLHPNKTCPWDCLICCNALNSGVPKPYVIQVWLAHYGDIIISAMASQITTLTIVYAAIYSAANHRKHQSSALLAFLRGIHRWPVNSPHKWPVTRKMFSFDDVIMIIVINFIITTLLVMGSLYESDLLSFYWKRIHLCCECVIVNIHIYLGGPLSSFIWQNRQWFYGGNWNFNLKIWDLITQPGRGIDDHFELPLKHVIHKNVILSKTTVVPIHLWLV